MPNQTTLYQSLSDLSDNYFGNSVTVSIRARLEIQLEKPLDELTPGDLLEQLGWLKSIACLFTNDKERVEDFALKAEILALNSEAT